MAVVNAAATTSPACPVCSAPIAQARTGRPARYWARRSGRNHQRKGSSE